MNQHSSSSIAAPTAFDLSLLSDGELRSATNDCRNLEAQGSIDVGNATRSYEAEMSRRFGIDTTIAAPLEDERVEGLPAWRGLLAGTIRLTGKLGAKTPKD